MQPNERAATDGPPSAHPAAALRSDAERAAAETEVEPSPGGFGVNRRGPALAQIVGYSTGGTVVVVGVG